MLPSIALRNLIKNRRRTILSVMAISIGTAGLFLTAGFIRFSFDGLREAIIRGGLGDSEVTRSDDSAVPSDSIRSAAPPRMTNWRSVRAMLESSEDARAAGAAVQFSGVATKAERTAAVLGVAVEPDRERLMGVTVRLRKGENLPETDDGDDVVLLGAGLARALNAVPGDTVALMGTTEDGTLNALDMRVVGVFSTGFQDMDDRIIKTTVASALRLLGTDAVTSIVVGLRDSNRGEDAAVDLRQRVAREAVPLSVTDWQTRAPFYRQVRALYMAIFVFLGSIVAVLVALSNANTLMMSVLERVREFGVLLAMGTSRAQLALLIVTEALWLAALGGGCGAVLGVSVALTINYLHIEMPPPPAAVDPIQLALRVDVRDLAGAVLFIGVVLVLSSIPPVIRVLRLQIVEAIGHA